MRAWIRGRKVSIDQALFALGMLLRNSRSPHIVAGAVDLAAAAALVDLARTARARLDHAARLDSSAQTSKGLLGTTVGEAVRRTDMLLLAGTCGPTEETRAVLGRLAAAPDRTILRLGASEPWPGLPSGQPLDLNDMPLLAAVGLIRARLKGRPIAVDRDSTAALDGFVARLKAARYGVIVTDPSTIDALVLESLQGLADELSATTRCSLLPLPVRPGVAELQRMAQMLTGLSQPICFAARRPEQDAWRFGAKLSANRRETDAALFVSARDEVPPEWLLDGPRVAALTAADTPCAGVEIQIETGYAGRDHAAIEEAPTHGAMTVRGPVCDSARPSAAEVLATLTLSLAEEASTAA